MPILNSEIRSYNIIFTGKKERLIQSLQENNLTQYIFLNDLLMVLYVEANFNENIFNNINQISSSFNFNALKFNTLKSKLQA